MKLPFSSLFAEVENSAHILKKPHLDALVACIGTTMNDDTVGEFCSALLKYITKACAKFPPTYLCQQANANLLQGGSAQVLLDHMTQLFHNIVRLDPGAGQLVIQSAWNAGIERSA